MAIGFVAVNFSYIQTMAIMKSIQGVTAVIFVIFFVTAGARLDIRMVPSISILGVVYIFARAFGKYFGSYFGAIATKSSENVRKYLGYGLLDQAGVAIGLAIAVNHSFSSMGEEYAATGQMIVNIITATVFITMILAPLFIKYAVFKSGESTVKQ